METLNQFNVFIADSLEILPDLPAEELQDRKLVVIKSKNKQDFITNIRNKTFDLIFICQDSNVFAGVESVELVRLSDKNKATPIIIVLESKPEKEIIDQLYKSGVVDVIFSFNSILHFLEKINTYQQLNVLSTNYKLENEKLIKESKQDKKLLEKAYKELSRVVDENFDSLLKLIENNDLLGKQIKERNCLITISKRSENEDDNIDSFLRQVVDIIKLSFPNPENISAEISYDNDLCRSDNFTRTKHVLCQDINYMARPIGFVCLYYNYEINSLINDPISKEDREFLETIANHLGLIIHRKETDSKLKIFQRAVDQSPLMISVINIATRGLEYLNPAYTKKMGYVLSDLTDIYTLIDIPNEQLRETREKIVKNISEGKPWSGTFKTDKKNGEQFWQRTSVYPLFENGEISHSLAISEDISDEIRMTEELAITRENYKYICENAPSAIFLVDNEQKTLFVNKKACTLTGYSNSELLTMKMKDIIHKDHLRIAQTSLKKRLAGNQIEGAMESAIVNKKEETLIVEACGSKTKWMGNIVDLVVMNDITKKKKLDNLLNIQNEINYLNSVTLGMDKSLNEIFKTLLKFEWIDGAGIYLMNDNKDSLDLNFFMGVSKEFSKKAQQVPKKASLFKIVQKKKNLYITSIATIDNSSDLEKEGIKAVFVFPLIYDDIVIGCINIISKKETNVTESEKIIFESISKRVSQMITLINTQNELQSRNEKLKNIIKEVNEKHQLLIQKSKLESLGEMAAGVAHEINQPLGIISLSLENILFKILAQKASPEYLDEKFNSIFNNIDKIKEIIDHVRTFSRDQKSMVFERVDINLVIEKACSLINEQYSYHNLSIVLDLEKDDSYTLGNNNKLEQVIYNLLSNAKFALHKKEMELSNNTFEKEIYIKTYSDEKRIYIDFKDNGSGIKEDDLSNVFNPFFTTKSDGEGTGLGLSIVYGIIVDMGGVISIKSEQNVYTLVKIELPKFKLKV